MPLHGASMVGASALSAQNTDRTHSGCVPYIRSFGEWDAFGAALVFDRRDSDRCYAVERK